MNKYKLIIEYDGTGYSGWQAQKNAKSIQETLISATDKLLKTLPVGPQSHTLRKTGKESVPPASGRPPAPMKIQTGSDNKIAPGRLMSPIGFDLQGAGRTDAGVHALGQVAHLETAVKIRPDVLRMGLNDLLPASIHVLSAETAHPRFHARHSALSRSYLYLISKRRTALAKKFVWWVKDPLDIKKMRQALSLFQGFHDFASFADKRIDKETSTKVNIESIELAEFENLFAIRISGSHFLWKMVRRIVGMTALAGRGQVTPRELETMLLTYSDVPARHTAPPSGLFLEKVLYEGDHLPPIRPPVHLA